MIHSRVRVLAKSPVRDNYEFKFKIHGLGAGGQSRISDDFYREPLPEEGAFEVELEAPDLSEVKGVHVYPSKKNPGEYYFCWPFPIRGFGEAQSLMKSWAAGLVYVMEHKIDLNTKVDEIYGLGRTGFTDLARLLERDHGIVVEVIKD